MGDFLYHTFSKSNTTNRSLTAYANKFLKGDSTYGVGAIVRLWMQSPDGAVGRSSDLASLLYNLDTPYDKIKSVRPALTSFAVQTMWDKLVWEAKAAVKPSSGLHVSVKPTKNQRRLQWVDVGSTTSSMVEEIFRQHQPLTWDYLTAIATAEPRKRNGVLQERKIRPVNRVSSTEV